MHVYATIKVSFDGHKYSIEQRQKKEPIGFGSVSVGIGGEGAYKHVVQYDRLIDF